VIGRSEAVVAPTLEAAQAYGVLDGKGKADLDPQRSFWSASAEV
jgi:hypothetical protein